MTVRSHVETEEWYASLDAGIRFAVRVLHARGIETCQSCQGGEGHAYERATVDLPDGPAEAGGFAALHYLAQYGLPVTSVARHWNVHPGSGLPYESVWRVTFARSMEDRADDQPIFVWGYSAAKPSRGEAPVGPGKDVQP